MTFSAAWSVLALFLIPIGGGIPAGVLLAKSRGFTWAFTALLYFISDLILACVFELLMHGFIRAAKTSRALTQWGESYRASLARTGVNYGVSTGPFALVMIAFGVDPMTGRVATHVAGHGFCSGWALSICGDMVFFALIMASTLWLNNILGDGTLAAVIVMVAMIGIPALVRRWRQRRRKA